MAASRIERELALVVTGKDVSASKTMRGVSKEVQQLQKVTGKAATNVGRNIERGVAVGAFAAAGAIGYVTNAAIDFESSSTSVAKTVGDAWRDVVDANRELANTIPVDVNTLNEISAAAGAMGVEGVDDINAFTKGIALLSQTADDVDAELGAEFLGHIRTNMGLTAGGLTRIIDLTTHLGNSTAATEGEILAMMEGVSGAAGFINASTDDVAAWSAAMASAGEEAEAGGSAIQRVWIDTAKFVADGGDEMKLMAKITGVSMRDFRRSFEKDGAGTIAAFMVKLGSLTEAEQLAHLEALGWDDIRITRALGKLLSNTGNLTNAYEETGQAAGAAAREAEIRFASTASQIDILQNNVNDAAITIGQELLPVVNELAGDATEWVRTHQPEIREFAADLATSVRDAVTWGKSLDWEMIGTSLQLAAGGAKTLVDMFMGMPTWVQTAVLTGWGLNKLTGGAIVDFGKLIFQRGMTPATPMFVKEVGLGGGFTGPTPIGPGGKPGGGKPGFGMFGGLGQLLKFTIVGTAGVFLVEGSAQALADLEGHAQANNDLAARGLTQDEIWAYKFFTGDQAYQQASLKHLGRAPSREDYESAMAKLEAHDAALSGEEATRQNVANERLEGIRGYTQSAVERATAQVVATERAEAIASQKADQQRAQIAAGDTRTELAIAGMSSGVQTKVGGIGGLIAGAVNQTRSAITGAVNAAKVAEVHANQQTAAAIRDKRISPTVNVTTVAQFDYRGTIKKATSYSKIGLRPV